MSQLAYKIGRINAVQCIVRIRARILHDLAILSHYLVIGNLIVSQHFIINRANGKMAIFLHITKSVNG